MSLVIAGGSVVSTSGATPADVFIEGERIQAVLDPRSDIARQVRTSADRTVDATGCYVLPGGVDVHVHLQMPAGPDATSSDTFATGTAAAAWGGTTTVIDFADQPVGTNIRDAVESRLSEADGQCVIDYGLHLAMGDVTPNSLKEMAGVMDDGITTFKYFMAYPGEYYSDDAQLLRAMRRTADLGALAMVHAENGLAIDVLREWAGQRGQTSPVWHGRTRPARLEAEAVHRASALADVAGAPLYVVHVSSAAALDQVRWARERGQNVSTDHCPFCDSEKLLGIDDFRATPNGVRAIEHRMDLLHTGVTAGELSLARWVETCATTPARMFGLYPRKGVVAPGSDADVVVYDPRVVHTLGADSHHMNVDNSVWEGFEVTGQVRTVVSRGRFVIDNGEFVGRVGHGQYLHREVSELMR